MASMNGHLPRRWYHFVSLNGNLPRWRSHLVSLNGNLPRWRSHLVSLKGDSVTRRCSSCRYSDRVRDDMIRHSLQHSNTPLAGQSSQHETQQHTASRIVTYPVLTSSDTTELPPLGSGSPVDTIALRALVWTGTDMIDTDRDWYVKYNKPRHPDAF